MTLIDWAQKYRVKVMRGRQGIEDLAPGKFGEIADTYGDGRLRLRLLAVPRDRPMDKALNSRKRKAELGGLKPTHVSPHIAESAWTFDPANESHSLLAIELACPKRRRTVAMTPEKLAALAAMRATRQDGQFCVKSL